MIQYKMAHLITDLSTGGADMMLYKLVSSMDRDKFEMQVVSLTDIGPIGKKIEDLGIPVRALGMKRGTPDPRMLFKLTRWLKKDRPDIIQTWMYHSDLMGGLAARLAGRIPVVWGIHHSNLDPKGNKRTTIWTAKTCAWFSRWLPVKIVCCSEASKRVHTALGYAAEKMVVIPNGFDLNLFKPDLEEGTLVRQELGIPEDTIIIGMVGRFDPQKDHLNFIKGAALLQKKIPDVQFLLCGDDVTWGNHQLSTWIKNAGLSGYFHLLGRRNDIPRIMTALDIASSSSYGEGFPNVVGEAMACGTPCVVTDVGDSASIVGDTGIVVPPKDSNDLALAWKELIEIGKDRRQRLGDNARLRIKENFSLPSVVRRYEELYESLP
jgi:glycosyltransferase involved in cell wall biosynthesis